MASAVHRQIHDLMEELLLSVLLRVHMRRLSDIDHLCYRITFVTRGTIPAHIQYSAYTHGTG